MYANSEFADRFIALQAEALVRAGVDVDEAWARAHDWWYGDDTED